MFNVNEYFDGRVKSIAFNSETADATIGVMAAGQYTFGANRQEIMHVINGLMKIRLPDTQTWETFSSGQQFTVQAGTKFEVIVHEDTAYLCEYL